MMPFGSEVTRLDVFICSIGTLTLCKQTLGVRGQAELT